MSYKRSSTLMFQLLRVVFHSVVRKTAACLFSSFSLVVVILPSDPLVIAS